MNLVQNICLNDFEFEFVSFLVEKLGHLVSLVNTLEVTGF